MATIKIEVDTEAVDHKGGRIVPFSGGRNKIGIVSSVKYTGNQKLKKAFDAGVNDSSILTKVEDERGYKKNDKSNLKTSIGNHLTTANLIVTVGGSIAYDAATEKIPITGDPNTQMHFLSMVGAVPAGAPVSFWGGVSLESYAAHADRVAALITAIGGGATSANIGLFRNKNSSMFDDEAFVFSSITGPGANIFSGGTDAGDNNVDNVYATNFGVIPAAVKGLIVSADPHFGNTRENLIIAANDWLRADNTRYICYCSLSFKNIGATAPMGNGRSFLSGPDMEHAYFYLGQLAVTALKTQAAMPVLRLPSTLVRLP